MAYKLEFFEAAESDLDEAIKWYAAKSLSAAQNFFDTYLKTLERISNNPFQFPKVRGEVRKARFSLSFPYNVYLFVRNENVFIVAVFHDKRNPNVWQERV